MKKFLFLFLALTVLSIPMVAYAAFSDVATDHWAYSFITELSDKGVINGFPDGSFGPNETLTYGQFLKLIVTASLDNVDYDLVETEFDHWAAPYLKVAQNYGAVKEGITAERLDQPISRIEVIEIMGICDIDMREHEQKSEESLGFSDIGGITTKQEVLLGHAVACGIIGGYPDGTFKPENSLTRAEASKILSVYMSI